MTTKQLTRVDLQEPGSKSGLGSVFDDVLTEETERLACEARDVLGYEPLRDHVRKERPHQNDNARLLSALRELNIQPFRTEQVEAHKKRIIQKFSRKPLSLLIKALGYLLAFSFFGGIAGLVITLVAAISAKSFGVGETVLTYSIGSLGVCFVVFAFTIATLLTIERVRPALLETMKWVRTSISQYEKQVPEFALATAVAVKRKLPDAEISVDHLVKVPDPILVVKLGKSDELYLEQWDESDFKAERQV